MAKQFQLGSLTVLIDDLELADALQNGCEWYIEQQEHHIYTHEATAFLLEHIAEFSGTPYPSRFASLASDSWRRGTILGWILMALLPEDMLEYMGSLS
jgi:hypothetical protein